MLDYDTAWIDDAIVRAACDAGQHDFPFVTEIRTGITEYLESKCPLKLLALEELFDRVRRMLCQIGCDHIAANLRPAAPPVTFSLVETANQVGHGFELGFFEVLRQELDDLRNLGVRQIHFSGLRESVFILRGTCKWNRSCELLLREIEAFLQACDIHSTNHTQAA